MHVYGWSNRRTLRTSGDPDQQRHGEDHDRQQIKIINEAQHTRLSRHHAGNHGVGGIGAPGGGGEGALGRLLAGIHLEQHIACLDQMIALHANRCHGASHP